MPIIGAKGAQSSQGFGQFALSTAANYIEDVFSTYLYTGNGVNGVSTQTITNGIDLATKEGLVWIKNRTNATDHFLNWQASAQQLASNTTAAYTNVTSYVSAFNTTGFDVKGSGSSVNTSGDNYVSWTFRKAPKFFDVVTYTGNGTTNTINHNLGSVPGCIIIKRTDNVENWWVYHRSLTSTNYYLTLNGTGAQTNVGAPWITNVTSTSFQLTWVGLGNGDGDACVAYLFAHDAGGFGLTGTDNVISCGSFTTDSSENATITLGYEPQWIILKRVDVGGGSWQIMDTMRGWNMSGDDARLYANLSNSENTAAHGNPTATGFTSFNQGANATCIYIAIRRGPMKTPTSGTSVYTTDTAGSTGTGVAPLYRSAFPVDLAWEKGVSATVSWYWTPRLLSGTRLSSDSGSGEATSASRTFDYQNGWQNGTTTNSAYRSWMFRRYPGVLDVVCYTGTEVQGQTFNHNLGVAPELMIIKKRNASGMWRVYSAALGTGYFLNLNDDSPKSSSSASAYWNNTTPTASVFTLGNQASVNAGGDTFVAYLFATVAGVSKVGSYTGTGTTKQIDCGFTGGARFVLIKRSDSNTVGFSGDWYVWDSARGIVAGNDPYLLLDSTAAEVTNTDYIDTYSAGFEISSTAPQTINASGGEYIFLAIA